MLNYSPEIHKKKQFRNYTTCFNYIINTGEERKKILKFLIGTSFPYFRVKLSCVCLMIAYRKKLPKVTQR